MKNRTLSYLFACLVFPSAAARADDEALRNDKPSVAQVVTLARLASRLCEGIQTDDGAIRGLMDKAGIADQDIQASGAFEAEDNIVARSFAQSVDEDRDRACSEIFAALGPSGGRLLQRKRGNPST